MARQRGPRPRSRECESCPRMASSMWSRAVRKRPSEVTASRLVRAVSVPSAPSVRKSTGPSVGPPGCSAAKSSSALTSNGLAQGFPSCPEATASCPPVERRAMSGSDGVSPAEARSLPSSPCSSNSCQTSSLAGSSSLSGRPRPTSRFIRRVASKTTSTSGPAAGAGSGGPATPSTTPRASARSSAPLEPGAAPAASPARAVAASKCPSSKRTRPAASAKWLVARSGARPRAAANPASYRAAASE
mmetsp:Transcript_5410/g.16738  ORF Transcript_5410/g.16738 Transcript_5410/m.16738 type:complete len:245 (+) Transcript_5410:206-940(+)